ncbi:MAG: outer membrane lipoprotein carrier protein LolA [Variovorax sp.]|nr:MAG: outer membrane lipoprotein carrier protein LolA [Variovorax sp.]
MISGSKMRIDRWFKTLLIALACTASSAWAFDLTELMAQLAKQKSGEARFTEQRFVRGLDGPLESAGTLSFTAPDKLARRTLTPRPESMVVDGNNLTLSRGSRTRTMTLDSTPELLGMVEAMRSTLGGDTNTLKRYFRSTVTGSAQNWTLDLAPIDERLAAQLRSLRMTGRAGEVLGLEMEFIGGDRSVMTISPTPGASRAAP